MDNKGLLKSKYWCIICINKIGVIMLIYGKTLNDYLKLAKAHKRKVAAGIIIVIVVLYSIF